MDFEAEMKCMERVRWWISRCVSLEVITRQKKAKRRVGSNVPEEVDMVDTFDVSMASASLYEMCSSYLQDEPRRPSSTPWPHPVGHNGFSERKWAPRTSKANQNLFSKTCCWAWEWVLWNDNIWTQAQKVLLSCVHVHHSSGNPSRDRGERGSKRNRIKVGAERREREKEAAELAYMSVFLFLLWAPSGFPPSLDFSDYLIFFPDIPFFALTRLKWFCYF